MEIAIVYVLLSVKNIELLFLIYKTDTEELRLFIYMERLTFTNLNNKKFEISNEIKPSSE